jgi:ABC-type sugar transport system substrate-binding protein
VVRTKSKSGLSIRSMRWCAVVGAIGLLAVVAAQGAAGSAAASSTRIAFFTDAQNNAYLQAAIGAAHKVAAKNGVSIDVLSADWDPTKQLAQVENAIASGKYKALVIEAISGIALCKSVKNAVKQGLVVAVYNTPICSNPTGPNGASKLHTPGTVGYFGRYEWQSGFTLGQQIASALQGKGDVGYISGPLQNSIVQATNQGIHDALKRYPGIHLVATIAGDWDAAKGLTATQDLVSSHDVRGIIYGVDQMAVPSIKWLGQNSKLNGVKIVSLGGTREGFALIKSGAMYSVINSLPQEEAAYALQAAINQLQHKEFNVPGWNPKTKVWTVQGDPRFHGNGAVVNKANVNKYPAEWGV